MKVDTELIKPGLHEVLLRFFDDSLTGTSDYRLPRVRIYKFHVEHLEEDLVCDFGDLGWKEVEGYHYLFEKLEVCLKKHNLLQGEVVVKSKEYMR